MYVWSQKATGAADKLGAHPTLEIPAAYFHWKLTTKGWPNDGERQGDVEGEGGYEAVKRKVRVERDLREAMNYLLVHSILPFFILYSSSSFSSYSSCSSASVSSSSSPPLSLVLSHLSIPYSLLFSIL